MSIRTLTRVSAAAGAACIIAGTLMFAMSPAEALEKERVVLGEDEKVSLTYGPLVGANQGALVDASTTVSRELCEVATFCDAIPLTVMPPRTFTDDDAEFYVNVRLYWDTLVVDVPVEGQTAVDDLDLWIVNDPFDPTAGPDTDGFAYKSAGLGMPEVVQMYAPVGDWYLLVNNAASRSLDYTLEIEWATSPFPSPFESLPPGFISTGSPVKPSLTTPPPVSPNPSPIFNLPAVPVDLRLPTPALADSSFTEGFADGAGLDDQLAAPPVVLDDLAPAAERAKPPSALAVLLWMVGFPLLLLGAGAWVLQRRRHDLISI
ncbi:MAG: hypothetical protein ACRDYW_11705 [Acidimicrobiales bacterium]